MIALIVLGGYRCAPVFPLPVASLSAEARRDALSVPIQPRARRKLSLRRRIWGTFIPPWPKE